MKNVFSRFEAMDVRMKEVMIRIENETRKHAAKARSLMEKNLQGGCFQKIPNLFTPGRTHQADAFRGFMMIRILSEFCKRPETFPARAR